MLSVKGLVKIYQTPEGPVEAVKSIDFQVAEGEFYTLIGPSGCGKTTTLRCIAGLEKPDGGQISIGNQVVADPRTGLIVPAHERNIGMVFQSYAIWPHLDVFDNVAYPLRVRKPRPPRAEIKDAVINALALVRMTDFASRASTKLSGGQQQRVALARALVHHPRLLLLDEPLSNLDAKLREEMRDELEEMVSRIAITTLYVTHDQAEALSMSDRIAVMLDGEIKQEGAPEEVYARPATGFVAAFLGTANFLTAKVEEMTASGSSILAVDGGAGRLEITLPDGARPGERYHIVVRPENLRIETDQPEDTMNVIAGAVQRLSFQGGLSECHIRAAGLDLRVVIHGIARVRPGDAVWLRIHTDQCVVFSDDQAFDGRAP